MNRPEKIFSLLWLLACIAGCKTQNTNPALPIPQDAQDFFVNYEPGTCWVYQDTLNPGRYDTIELVSKTPFSVTPDGDIPNNDGFAMYYKPDKTSDFTIYIQPGANNTCNINIAEGQHLGGSETNGQLDIRYDNYKWPSGFYNDSLSIGNKMYHKVLAVNETCHDFSNFIFARDTGLVAYKSQGLPGIAAGNYIFVRKFKK